MSLRLVIVVVLVPLAAYLLEMLRITRAFNCYFGAILHLFPRKAFVIKLFKTA